MRSPLDFPRTQAIAWARALHCGASIMQRRSQTILVSVLAATLISLVGRPSEAKPSKPLDVIELEILEYTAGSKKPTHERTLTVAVSGKIEGWADLFGEAGTCKLRSSIREAESIRLDLDCETRAGNTATLQLEVERVLVLGEPTLLGIIDAQDDRRIEVIATRR
jgi:hypothetical protein